MKTFKLKIVFAAFAISCTVFSQETRKVLFLGNSYTQVNNLPQIVANVAVSAGNLLHFNSNRPSGYEYILKNETIFKFKNEN
jgi:hypothetical protein